MITFNKKHFNLGKIAKASNLEKCITKKNYRIFGIAGDSSLARYAIIINIPDGIDNSDWEGKLNQLEEFFAANNFAFCASEECSCEEIRIGLRQDIREHPKIAGAALQTVIAFFEGRLASPLKFTIPGIPKFNINEDV